MAEFPTLADIFEPIEGKTGIEANEQMRRWYTGTRQLPGAAPSEAVTIADDVITPTSADVIVDTEGQAPADDLQIIKTESTHDGMILSLRAANPDRVVTVLATGQLNGITLWNRAERYVLSTDEQLVLQRDGNAWREIRGIGLALAEDSELTLENTEMAVRASQHASLYFRTATLEGRKIHDVGDIQLKPFRYNALPSGWYFCNGDNYALTSAVGAALNALTATFKTDWGIVVSGSNISLPNMFYTDGRGYYLRAVNGSARQAGSLQNHATTQFGGNIYSVVSPGDGTNITTDGVFSNSGWQRGANFYPSPGGGVFNISMWVGDATETRSLNRGMTPAIYLGV